MSNEVLDEPWIKRKDEREGTKKGEGRREEGKD
jgi:hypothetical protein